jgi:RNA ligase (TIGR02306 family)
MERKLATIQKISWIKPIPNADKIEVAGILGWQIVINKKEGFKVGDKVVFCEIDSIVPERPEFEFLRPRGFRVKTIKLRGQVSQGLALPISILPIDNAHPIWDDSELTVGLDVTDILDIKKYVPYIPACLAGEVKGQFPSFIPKTDETRIQSVPDVLTRHNRKTFIVTEKVDGSSMTVYYNNGEFGVCSRNLDLKETEKNSFWKVARKLEQNPNSPLL